MSTPNQLSDTPRTDAAWAKTFQDDEDQCRAGNAATDMRDECATLERELAALAAERDQLRAALALGQQNCDDAYDDLRAERAAAIARAESAEREAFDWKKIARYEAARAERAEAELASERGRLDYLSTRGFEHRHHETGDHLGYEWTISSYSESEDVTLRDVIDAEMREDEK